MRKIGIIAVLSLLVVAIAAVPVLAASPHFKKGGSPVCTVSPSGSTSSTTCTASLSGLGGGIWSSIRL